MQVSRSTRQDKEKPFGDLQVGNVRYIDGHAMSMENAYEERVCRYFNDLICRSVVTLVSPAKTAEPIEIPFGLRTRMGPRNRVLDGSPDPPWEGQF